MTNEGPKTDDTDGSSCRGPQLLRTVWKKPWRVETELTERERRGWAKRTDPTRTTARGQRGHQVPDGPDAQRRDDRRAPTP